METNLNLYQQHLSKGWKSYLALFIENLIIKEIPLQQQLIIDKCFENIESNNMDSISFELIIHQLAVDLNEQMILWRMIKNLRINQLFTRGPLHVYLISLPDIKSCLPEISRLIGVFLEASYSLSSYQSNQDVIIEPQELVEECPASFLKADTALCLTLYILRQLAGSKFDYDTIFVPNKREHFDINVAREITNAKIIFHDGPLKASIPVEQLSLKNNAFDKKYCQQLKHQVSELLSTLDQGLSLTEKVKKYILTVEKPAMQTLDVISESFGMSQTTFRRKLKMEQQNFKEIQNKILEDISIKALTTTNMKIEEFAQYIGYAERSSFERSFKNRLGLSPAKYRKKHRV
jgi:AraC-like DNA-binding protein